MTKILGYIALLTLIVCVLVHLATFVPAIHISMDQVWPLHIAVFALGAMLVFTVISFTNPRESRTKGWVWVNRQYADYQKMKELDARIRSDSPRWLRVACIVSGIYVFVNFALYFWLSEGGSPEIEGAKYFLSNHGRVIREITEAEYHRFHAYLVRFVSGFWIAISLVTMAYAMGISRQVDE